MRLTLDFDNLEENDIRKILKYLRLNYPKNIIKYRKSASKKGYHIVVYGAFHNHKNLLLARYQLCDDDLRRKIDVDRIQKGMCYNILFTKKNGKKAGKWRFLK